MRFTLVILAAALLLTNSIESRPQIGALQDEDGDSWMFESNTPQVNPMAGTVCNSLVTCPRGLSCFYKPVTTPPPLTFGSGLCYSVAGPGRPCNTLAANGPIVLCGEAQECSPIPTTTGGSSVCRPVVTHGHLCRVPGILVNDWCSEGQVCHLATVVFFSFLSMLDS